jgi:hypothetical protein
MRACGRGRVPSGEAAANGIEHAYDGSDEGFSEVSLCIEGRMVVASVMDLVDDVDLRPEEGGTMVTMRKAIHEVIAEEAG